MIVPAFDYRDKIEEAWAIAASHPDFLFWDVSPQYYHGTDTDPRYKQDEWVSLNQQGEVVGYFCAFVDKATISVDDISIAKFKDDKSFAFDLVRFIRNMRRRYRVTRWACVIGNPSEKNYDRIALLYGGRIVGTFSKKVKLLDGRYYDEKWYEVERASKMKKVPPEFRA